MKPTTAKLRAALVVTGNETERCLVAELEQARELLKTAWHHWTVAVKEAHEYNMGELHECAKHDSCTWWRVEQNKEIEGNIATFLEGSK